MPTTDTRSDRWTADDPSVGDILHVAAPGEPCYPALVLDTGPELVAVLVFRRGLNSVSNEVGDVAHWTRSRPVPNPPADDGSDTGFRELQSWHGINACRYVRSTWADR